MVPSILSLVLTNLIITNFGSDANGIFVTINQIIAFLVLLEGGFTLASNVALFQPYIAKDYEKANSILTATSKAFSVVGLIYGAISILIAISLPYFVKSNLNNLIIVELMLLASANTLYSFLFEYRYRILFQTTQKEYVVLVINAISSSLGYVLAISFVHYGFDIVMVRIALLLPVIIRMPILVKFHKKNFPWANFKTKPDYKSINGTIDVFLQKLSDMLFFNTPVIVISIMTGTVYASVYAIYNSIYSLIRNIIYSFVMAPFNGFGQIINQKGKNAIVKIFHIYQLIIIMISTSLLTTTTILILPFVKLYTSGITDVKYMDCFIALLFLASGLLETMHISSRGILNISGNFKFMRKVVTISAITNLITSVILTNYIGIYGAIIGSVVGYMVLMPITVYYAHVKYLECGLKKFFMIVIPNIVVSIILVAISFKMDIYFVGYLDFILKSGVILVMVTIIVLIINYITNTKLIKECFNKFIKR